MIEACITFARDAQDEVPLRHAAYRISGTAACQIDAADGVWTVRLSALEKEVGSTDRLRGRFLTILNDENLRETIEQRTAGLRDVIVALAFGALAREEEARG